MSSITTTITIILTITLTITLHHNNKSLLLLCNHIHTVHACTDNVLKTTLALYMEGGDQSLPMPTYEEVLVCSKQTTDEEVVLLWKRALGDPGHFRVFCLVHAEQLSYQVCDRALWSLSQLSQGQKGEASTCTRTIAHSCAHYYPAYMYLA